MALVLARVLGRLTRWRRAGAIAAALMGIAWLGSGMTARQDLTAFDAEMRLAARFRSPRQADDLVIVAVDEATLNAIPEPLSLLHRHLGAVLDAMADVGARAAAIDLILPERSFDGIAAGYDARLAHGILAMRRRGVVVLARTVDDAGRQRPIHPLFVGAAGEQGTALALLPVDADGVVRRFTEHLVAEGGVVPTFVGQLARRLGFAVADGTIDFSRDNRWSVISMNTVLDWIRNGDQGRLARAFGGRIVMIGALLGFQDEHRVPVELANGSMQMPGIFIHAQALQDVRARSLIRALPAWTALLAGPFAALCWLASGSLRRAALTVVTVTVLAAAAGLWLLLGGWFVPLASLCAIGTAAAAARMVGEIGVEMKARQRLRRLFSGYVSPDVLTELENGRLDGVVSARHFICVVFIDIRGFTTRSERESPERVTATLNQFFEMATRVIHGHGGTIKEFMGDGVMAFFGAPKALADPVRPAFDAAREVLTTLPEVNARVVGDRQDPLSIGIGIACGEAVVGHVGSADRHTYGAVGDCVNVASRLEGLTKELGYPLLVSGEVASRIGDGEGLANLGEHRIKGHRPVRVHGWPEQVRIGTYAASGAGRGAL